MIQLDGVEKYYGAMQVLKGISLTIGKGEFVSIMGSSGSGKSTLLNLIGGMDQPDRGKIMVGGQDLATLTDGQLTAYRRRQVGFIFQFFNLLPNLTVFENVQMPLLLNEVFDEAKVRSCLELVGLVAEADRLPHELSGGQQQRVAIARALVHDPGIILADEPTGSLDTRNGAAIMELLISLAKDGSRTIVLVTHETYVARYSGRTLKISDGLILP